jgi:ABC-2 type transport system permease protein
MIQQTFRPLWAFVFRDYHLNRRYLSWVIVFTFYAIVSAATVCLIGVDAKSFRLTLNLILGALLWTFLSALYEEVANSISYERWEGTLEYTFMAPVNRLVHLLGVSFGCTCYSVVRTGVVMAALLLFVPFSIAGANLFGIFIILLVSSLAFIGLGLMAAVLPLMSPEKGAEATHIFQGILLLISGVYYRVDVLPAWIRPLSVISPATYALSAGRKLLGTENPASTSGHMLAVSLGDVLPEIIILLVMGLILIPAGLFVFSRAERWAKRTGKLKRTG